MAFNPVEYLKEGKIEFVFNLTTYDEANLIKRIRNSFERDVIIDGFLDKLKDYYPRFCFNIIYDNEKYKEVTFDLLKIVGNVYLDGDPEKVKNVLYNTTWGMYYIIENFEAIISAKTENIYTILEYAFVDFDKKQDLIKLLSFNRNLHIRYLFMHYLITKHEDKVNVVYDDITKYYTSYTDQENEQMTFLPEFMDSEDISNIAFALLKSNLDKRLYLKTKNIILDNYKQNYLASLILSDGCKSMYLSPRENLSFEQEFINDADILFKTSADFKLFIYENYSKYVSQELLEEFVKYLKYFYRDDKLDMKIYHIMYYSLWDSLQKYIDKYLSLSVSKECKFLGRGTTTSCFQIGDFVAKINDTKWSYEDVICPNIFLIIKNLEEHYVRNDKGIVLCGLEIQQRLTKTAANVPSKIFTAFRDTLTELGYRFTDTLVHGTTGDNCMLLNSYKDADCYNPECLPDWFKEFPLVLIDRDRIYPNDTVYIKQLRESWS